MTSPGNNKALFILNPNAGVPPVKFIISKELERRKHELSCYKSLSVDDSGALIKNNLEKYDVFIAAGGDGTVHTVAGQLIGKGKILGVLPIGSGNGFAKELGFKPKLKSLLSDISRKESRDIDVFEINDHLCLNVAGTGLDSFVAHSFDKLKTRGFWSYGWVTMINFIRLRPFHISVLIAGKEVFSGDLFVLTIANTRQFGNNAFIAPKALHDDGMIDLVLIRPFPKLLFPIFIYRLFAKTMDKSKYVRHLKTDEEVIIRTGEKRFHIDGEAVMLEDDVKINIKKGALKVLKTRYMKLP